ncbi:23S rRNA (pseudouridine1915-N3)-methyltransferase [Steroidobacter denitrificans]|uniref:Ribosomal RNA large subunit methyltransferase H n=1 Tax=Steroidobacter denitrificans TaxID=465721 RepID=A0A127FAJ0_STEDE|nr:23S rRNA (pseudouridine(1915)-N(3))-methyltransferase RlmH [Steroidobacter denitrificans]AMN46641.1 23S rRNA (pseudouridine1915-N3)-methyltransferase [Steroidobacter denitrificans]
MRLILLAAGTRLPRWVDEGVQEYARRFGRDHPLELHEIALGRRTGGDPRQAVAKEGARMLAVMPPGAYVVALQVDGRALSSEQLAQFLDSRMHDTRDIVFCIGGPDGLAPEVDARARMKWSLSALTLPHALARVIAAEALYRAVSIIKGHPYHRA